MTFLGHRNAILGQILLRVSIYFSGKEILLMRDSSGNPGVEACPFWEAFCAGGEAVVEVGCSMVDVRWTMAIRFEIRL